MESDRVFFRGSFRVHYFGLPINKPQPFGQQKKIPQTHHLREEGNLVATY